MYFEEAVKKYNIGKNLYENIYIGLINIYIDLRSRSVSQ